MGRPRGGARRLLGPGRRAWNWVFAAPSNTRGAAAKFVADPSMVRRNEPWYMSLKVDVSPAERLDR